MPYILHRLAAGSYDLIRDGTVVGSVVRDVTKGGDVRGWHAELLSVASPLPPPFTQAAHRFDTLEAAVAWLDAAHVESSV
jgi:hypothetical protein